MWKMLYSVFLVILFVLGFGACDNGDDSINRPDEESGVLSFVGEMIVPGPVEASTRVYNNKWEQRDLIGVFMHKKGEAPSSFVSENSRYIADLQGTKASTEFRYANEGDKIYFPLDGAEYAFKAYYPYNKNLLSNGYDMAIDLSDQTNRGNADLVVAQTNYFSDQSVTFPINLEFENVLARIKVRLKAGVGVTEDEIDSGIFKLVVTDIPISGDYNFVNDALFNISNEQDVQLLYNPAIGGYSDFYDAKVFPMSDITKVYLKVYYGNDFIDEVPLANVNISSFERATEYMYELTISSTSVDMTSSIAWRSGVELELPVNYVNPLKMQFNYIPGGTFYMGSPTDEEGRDSNERQHQVQISSFYAGRYEVTNAQFAAFLNAKGAEASSFSSGVYEAFLDLSYINPSYGRELLLITSSVISTQNWGIAWNVTEQKWVPANIPHDPCIQVSWWGAFAFAHWVGGRLLTEAEWEYACRGTCVDKANVKDTFPWYTRTRPTTSDAWFYRDKPTGVGAYPPNSYGLYNMIANVYEWCSDWYDDNYGLSEAELSSLVIDPQGPTSGDNKVVRGATYYTFDPNNMRSAKRRKTNYPSSGLGFRVAKDYQP